MCPAESGRKTYRRLNYERLQNDDQQDEENKNDTDIAAAYNGAATSCVSHD